MFGVAVTLPEKLVTRFPELAGVHWRRGGLPVHVAGWLLGKRSVAAITLWRTVFLARDVAFDAELLLHELRHVHQFAASRSFPVAYLWESVRRGYFANRFEADARAYASRRMRGDP